MKKASLNQSPNQPIAASAVLLIASLLVTGLLLSVHSARVTAGQPSGSQTLPEDVVPVSPSSPTQALLPKSTSAYNGVTTPATKLYAPWLLGGTSVVRVYNAGENPTTVRAAFFDGDTETTVEKMLPSGAIGEITTGEILTATRLSAIITGTEPIVAVVNDFGPQGRQAASYAAMPASLGQTYLMLPDIIYESSRGGSQILVQNVGTESSSVTIVYTQTLEASPINWTDSVQDLAPGEIYFFDPAEAGLSTEFEGIATIKAAQPIVAVVHNAVFDIGALYPDHVYVYRVPLTEGTGNGDRSLFFPILVNAYESWTNGWVRFMNPRPTPTTFDLLVGEEMLNDLTLSAWGADFYGPSTSTHGEDWVGPGRVEQALTLQGLVWLRGSFQGDFLAAYTPPSTGAKTWYLPYADQADRFTTYVAVQNLSAVSSAQITLTYHNLTGTLSSLSGGSIAPFDARLYASAGGFDRGVTIESDQPVAAVAVIAGRLVLDKQIFLPILAKQD